MKRFLKRRYLFIAFIVVIIAGFCIPQHFSMPVKGANNSSYNHASFWYYPWGKSVTHKGIDIFAKEGTPVVSSTPGIVLFKGEIGMGGNVLLVLGAKWRLHYYAHLKEINTGLFSVVGSTDTIASVGTTGNAKGKPPHLHYAIFSLFPHVWRADSSPQGWKKMFYLNPIDYLRRR